MKSDLDEHDTAFYTSSTNLKAALNNKFRDCQVDAFLWIFFVTLALFIKIKMV